jgi:hypothetical protein
MGSKENSRFAPVFNRKRAKSSNFEADGIPFHPVTQAATTKKKSR